MLIEFKVGVNPAMIAANLAGRSTDEVIAEINRELAIEGKKHFGAGKITVGKLEDGRWFFYHLILGRMVRVPYALEERAVAELPKILPAVRIAPAPGTPLVEEFHGVWASQSFVDKLVEREKLTLEIPHEQVAHVA